jgi:hypothetical protein
MTSIDTADALFASYLQPSDQPTSAQVAAAAWMRWALAITNPDSLSTLIAA